MRMETKYTSGSCKQSVKTYRRAICFGEWRTTSLRVQATSAGESVLAGTAAVLALSPGHPRAMDLRSTVQESLIALEKEAAKWTMHKVTKTAARFRNHLDGNPRYK